MLSDTVNFSLIVSITVFVVTDKLYTRSLTFSKSTVLCTWKAQPLNFNLGHIDWSIPQVIPGKPDAEHHNKLLELLENCNLQQIVNTPTRKERILDLILVNNSTHSHNYDYVTTTSST